MTSAAIITTSREENMAPPAAEVCRRFCRSPLPFLSVVAVILEIAAILAVLIIGNYYAYNSQSSIGLCYLDTYPSLRRTCVVDIMSGAMAVIVAILLLMFECVSAYLNQRDWKVAFIIVKLSLIFITAVILFCGAIYGTLTYVNYCDDTKYCKFSHRSDNYNQLDINQSVDFSIVIITSGICAVWWVLILLVEIIRACSILNTRSERDDFHHSAELRRLINTSDNDDD